MARYILQDGEAIWGEGDTDESAIKNAIEVSCHPETGGPIGRAWIDAEIKKGARLIDDAPIDQVVPAFLHETYGADEDLHIRRPGDPEHGPGGIEVYSKRPLSNAVGWWFAGYEDEIRQHTMHINVDLNPLRAAVRRMCDDDMLSLQSEDAWLNLDMLSQNQALQELRDGEPLERVKRRCLDCLHDTEYEHAAENAVGGSIMAMTNIQTLISIIKNENENAAIMFDKLIALAERQALSREDQDELKAITKNVENWQQRNL